MNNFFRKSLAFFVADFCLNPILAVHAQSQDFAPSSHTVICEKHFRRYDFISDTQNLDRHGKTKKKKKLKLKAIPSLYMSGDLTDETWNYSDNIGDDQYQSDDNEGN